MTDENLPKFATYRVGTDTFYGVHVNGGMVALSPDFPQYSTLRHIISAGALDMLAQHAQTKKITHINGKFCFEIPIPNPEKILCVGVNYNDKNSPYKSEDNPSNYMSLFYRTPRSFVGHNVPIVRPKVSKKLDYEAEIAIIIGKDGRHIKSKNAYDYIAGITLCNEGSVRDWTTHSKFNVTPGKNFDKSGAMGPYLIPFKNPKQLDDITLQAYVNGHMRQNDHSKNMIHTIKQQIEYISTFTTLVAGDIIVTGTPAGSGVRLTPPVFLTPNDTVIITADGLGKLENSIIDEI